MKKIKKILIGIIIVGLYNTINSFAFDADVQHIESMYHLINTINPKLVENKRSDVSKKQLIKDFCQTITNEKYHNKIGSKNRNYDSKQSVFLYLLCNNQGLNYKSSFSSNLGINDKQYLKYEHFAPLNYSQHCPEQYQESCNITQLSYVILTDILNELFILQQARTVGLIHQANNAKTTQTKMDQLAKEFFLIEGFCSNKANFYPNTCTLREKDIKKAYTTVKKNKIFNSEILLDIAEDKTANKTLQKCMIYDTNYDLIICGTFGETEQGLKPFLNLIYNEILWYQLFSTYYQEYLLGRNPSEISVLEQQELIQIPKNLNLIYQTTHQSIRDLLDFSNSYMIHIGLLSYQEDLLNMRTKYLSKVITPFYNIYEKLRNAQIQDN